MNLSAARAAARTVLQVDFTPRRATAPATGRIPRVVRLLALAHRIDAMITAGQLRDLASAARRLGLTRARVTQIMNLTLLAPELQLALLELPPTAGRDTVTERSLRRIVAEPLWERQVAMFHREAP